MTAPVYVSHRFWVPGVPVPQGSHVGNGRGGVRAVNAAALDAWRKAIAVVAVREMGYAVAQADWPVDLTCVFRLPRPKSHYGTGRNAGVLKASAPAFPTRQGTKDADKLARAVGDALTMAGVWADDAQVCDLRAAKRWADLTHGAGMSGPGVDVLVGWWAP